MARKKRFSYYWMVLAIILAGTAGWALYSLINMGAGDLLSYFGVTNPYIQNISVILFVVALFVFSGLSIKRSVRKVVK